MPKRLDTTMINTARKAYDAAIARGLTPKKAVTATAEELEIPRRRIAEWAKRFDWESQQPETREAYIRRLAAQAQVSEKNIENSLRVKELEEAGEIPKGTSQRILAGETTQRKVLNAYEKVKRQRTPEPLREHKITLSLTKQEINATLAVADGSESEADNELCTRTLLKLFEALRQQK